MKELYAPQELDRIVQVLDEDPYEGYPEQGHRLFIDSKGLEIYENRLIVPDGPWHVARHINREGAPAERLDPEIPSYVHHTMLQTVTDRLLQQGQILFDQYGLPIHPGFLQLLSDRRIGMPTGVGFFWKYGENHTADPVIYRRKNQGDDPEFLLIQRAKGLRWALPGGFVDASDGSPNAAARREAGEETGLADIAGSNEMLMDKRPVGRRDTLHAWTRNSVVLIHGNQEYLYDSEPQAKDDAVDVGWFTIAEMQNLKMFDAHPLYIGKAAMRLAS